MPEMRLFDAKGRFLREETAADWSLQGLKGTVAGGTLTVAADPVDQAGLIKATAGTLTGEARARVEAVLTDCHRFTIVFARAAAILPNDLGPGGEGLETLADLDLPRRI